MPSFAQFSSRAAGLRRTTPDTLAATEAARLYRSGVVATISRTNALRLGKLAAAALGLKSAKIALIDQLFAYTQAVDWTDASSPPVVWPSNEALARSLGVSVSTMKHHLNGLCRAGLITFKDGPTYQRRGRRDSDGRIIEAHGIDLSPIASRYAELTELVDTAAYTAREWKRLSGKRTILRKEIQSIIVSARTQSFEGRWDHAQARLDVLREAKPSDIEALSALVGDLEELLGVVEADYSAALDDLNINTTVSKFAPNQTTAEHSTSDTCKEISPRAYAREEIHQPAFGRNGSEGKPSAISQPSQQETVAVSDDLHNISLPLIKAACPALSEYIPGVFDDWSRLRGSGHDLCRLASINPQVWQEALSVLGANLAVAALAVTLQKSSDGHVAKPGAYMRTLVQRGRSGQLHISRSLFGMAAAQLTNVH